MGCASLNRKPVTIRGVTYPSREHAARALGVTPTTIAAAVRRNFTDTVGLKRAMGVMAGGRMPHPITIRGVTYPSQAAAAAALSVSRSRISAAKREGTLDRVGLRALASTSPRGYRRDGQGRIRSVSRKDGQE